MLNTKERKATEGKESQAISITELEIPLKQLTEARKTLGLSPRHNREKFNSLSIFPDRTASKPATDIFQNRNAAPILEVRHPVLTFIDELTGALRTCSDQCLRPMPTIGIVSTSRQEINFSDLLAALESGEKRLGLISNSKPSFDVLANTSRHLALEAEFVVRALRRSIITSSPDPEHPGEQKASALLESVDSLYHQLSQMKLKFEDLAAGLFLQSQNKGQPGYRDYP